MQTERGNEFEAIFERDGVEIRNIRENASVAYMQGDDATSLHDDLERIATFTYPRGPVADVEQMIDLILEAYA